MVVMKRQLTLLTVMALTLLACGDTAVTTTVAPSATTTASPTTAVPETTAGATTTAAEVTTTTLAADASVNLATSDLGEILVDGEGRTLYLFMPDAQGDPTCSDQCADTWPAFTATGGAGDGVDASLLGTVTRTDGGEQVTYNGWPLYFFVGDAAPGDTNGQGLNGIWWVVNAAGEAVSG